MLIGTRTGDMIEATFSLEYSGIGASERSKKDTAKKSESKEKATKTEEGIEEEDEVSELSSGVSEDDEEMEQEE